MPADDLTDPAATHIFSHLSASVVLSRKRASQGLYPAVDPLQSDSKMLNPAVVGKRHYQVARAERGALAEYEELKDIISMLGEEELSQKDRDTVSKARRLERFLTQPFFTTEQLTEHFVAVDEGTLVKCGSEVLASVRDGALGKQLDQLQALVKEHFLQVDEHDRTARTALSRLEAGTIRRFMELEERYHD